MVAELNWSYSGFSQELYWYFSKFQCDRNDKWFSQRRIDEYIGYKLENGEDVSMVLYNIESLKNTFIWILQPSLTMEENFYLLRERERKSRHAFWSDPEKHKKVYLEKRKVRDEGLNRFIYDSRSLEKLEGSSEYIHVVISFFTFH